MSEEQFKIMIMDAYKRGWADALATLQEANELAQSREIINNTEK